MAEALDLTQFKRNGTYSLFVDDSEFADLPADAPLYCIVIQSKYKNAPINNLVKIENPTQLLNTFGKRDKAQERKGNYSMILAELMLSQGEPIYVLNLRDYSDEQKTSVVSISTANDNTNGTVELVKFKDLYDRSTFWKLDRDKFTTSTSTNVMDFAIIDGNKHTLYIRNASELPDTFYTTIGEHKTAYPSIDIDWLPNETLISDTFVDVFIFNKDLTNSVSVNNPTLANYLDASGNVKKIDGVDSLSELSKLGESNFVGKITGSLAQEILSINGDSYYLENLVNGNTANTGVGLKINLDVLHEFIDWDADNGAQPLSLAFNSLNLTNVSGETNIAEIKTLSYDLVASDETNSIEVTNFNGLANLYVDVNTASNYTDNNLTADYVEANVQSVTGTIKMSVGAIPNSDTTVDQTKFYSFGDVIIPSVLNHKVTSSDVTSANITNVQFIGTHNTNPTLQTVDVVIDPNTNLIFPKDTDGDWIYPTTWASDAGVKVAFNNNGKALDDASGSVTEIIDLTLTAEELATINTTYANKVNVYEVSTDRALKGLTGDFTDTDNHKTITIESSVSNVGIDYPIYSVTADVTLVITPESRIEKYSPIQLNGVTLEDSQFMDGTSIRMNEILDMLDTNTFRNGMLDTDKYGFKIIADGFETYIETGAKSQLSRLAMDSKRYEFIASMPFMKSFKDSNNPYFKDDANSVYDSKYIVEGGNKSLPYTNAWSMPSGELNGDYAVGFFSSNLIYSDGIVSTVIPSGPVAALNWGANFIKNNRAPYDPVGGKESGLIEVPGIIGLSHEFSISERDDLEPAGYNLIIPTNDGKMMIYNSATAKQSPKSALSSLENSFLMLYIADKIDLIIKTTPFKRNTKELRDAKKLEADNFMDRLVVDGAVSRYLNICDTTNNTADVRKRGFFVLDTEVYASNGIKIAVHRTTIKTETDEA